MSTVSAPALIPYTQAGLTTAVIKTNAGTVGALTVWNPNATRIWIQFFDTRTTPTLGTSVLFAIPVAPTSELILENDITELAAFATGIAVGAATTANGNTAPSTAPDATFFYD